MNEQVIQQITQLVAAAQQGNKDAVKTLLDIETKAKQGDKQATAIMQVVQQIMQQLQGQTQAARHGAKLQYVRSLKNQCPEGEELYYYKKGGSVGCGCKKKEDGGEVVKANMGVVANFKEDLKKKQQQNQQLQKPKWTDVEDNELKKLSEKKNPTSQEKQRLQQLRNKFKNSSNTKDYEVEEGKKGMKVEKNCGGSSIVKKFKAAKCGTKMKKHRLGGSLNGIPFIQDGTPKGGISLYFPKRPISGAEAYMNDIAINDPKYKMYNNKANAYSNEAPTISNTFNTLLNKLKAYYHGNKAAIKGYADKVDEYSRYLWNRGNYGKAIFGSPFVPIIRDYQPNRPFIDFINK